MNDPLIVLGIAEAVLFLATFGVLSGAKELAPGRKKVGMALLVVWLVMLAACIVWIIIRKSAE